MPQQGTTSQAAFLTDPYRNVLKGADLHSGHVRNGATLGSDQLSSSISVQVVDVLAVVEFEQAAQKRP